MSTRDVELHSTGITATMTRRKKVAMSGGSFDPITIAHLMIAADVIHFKIADEVWLLPCGNRSDKDTIVDAGFRLRMCELAVKSTFPSEFPVLVTDTEIRAGCYMPTVFLMRNLRSEHPDVDFSVVIGSDLVPTLPQWDLPQQLLHENKFIVVPRCGTSGIMTEPEDVPGMNRTTLQVSDDGFFVGLTNISSTEARHRLEAVGISGVAGIVPLPVLEFIRDAHLYGC